MAAAATASDENAFVTFTRIMNSRGAGNDSSYVSPAQPAKPNGPEAELAMAATAAGYTGKLADIKPQLEAARSAAEKVVKTGGVKGAISDQEKAALIKKATSSVEFQAASKEAHTGKGFFAGVRKYSFMGGAGIGGATTGLLAGAVATVLKIVAAPFGKAGSVNIGKTALWAAGIGAAAGAVLTSPVTWIAGKFSKSKANDNKARQLAMEKVVAGVIEKAEHGQSFASVAPQQAAGAGTPEQAKTTTPDAKPGTTEAAVATAAVVAGGAAAVAASANNSTPLASVTNIADARARRDANNAAQTSSIADLAVARANEITKDAAAKPSRNTPEEIAQNNAGLRGAVGAGFDPAKPVTLTPKEVEDNAAALRGAAGASFGAAPKITDTNEESARKAAAALAGAAGAAFANVSGGETAKLDQNTVANVKPAEKTETTARA